MSTAREQLVTYALLGQIFKESLRLKEPVLELVEDGWQVRTPEHPEPIPLSVPLAYEASGYDQEVLDATRRLCGTLRLRKRGRKAQELLAELRSGLAEARNLRSSSGSRATATEGEE